MTKLHEIIAVEADRESAAQAVLDETNNTFTKKADHFMGKLSVYTPFDENALDADERRKEIDTTVHKKLDHLFKILAKAVDVSVTKDVTNQLAKASIVVKGKELTDPLPATTLLMLENRLKRWIDLFRHIPTLAPGKKWVLDESQGPGIYRDEDLESKFRTQRTTKHKVLVEATEHHPAQIDKWQEDERIGKITETVWSGMLSPADKSALIERALDLHAAIKQARQRANCQEVQQTKVAKILFDYILG